MSPLILPGQAGFSIPYGKNLSPGMFLGEMSSHHWFGKYCKRGQGPSGKRGLIIFAPT